MILTHITAMSKNRIIGRDGGLPWHIPEDLKFFKEKTKGKVMIMGRKTFESLPGILPNRLHIVITRDATFQHSHPMVKVVKSIDEAIVLAKTLLSEWPEEVFIIGGGEIYKQTMTTVDKIYLTVIDQEVQGDTSYPEVPEIFKLTFEDPRRGNPSFVFQTWQKSIERRKYGSPSASI